MHNEGEQAEQLSSCACKIQDGCQPLEQTIEVVSLTNDPHCHSEVEPVLVSRDSSTSHYTAQNDMYHISLTSSRDGYQAVQAPVVSQNMADVTSSVRQWRLATQS